MNPPASASRDPESLARLRGVQRAATELRRGNPVLLWGTDPLAIIAAETVGPNGLDELARLGAAPPVLVLSPTRAAALLRRPVTSDSPANAIRLPAALLHPDRLRETANPATPQPAPAELDLAPALPAGPAALSLLKLARLLPAALAVPATPDAQAIADRLGLVQTTADDVLSYRAIAALSLRRVAEAAVPLEGAEDCRIVAFRTEDGAVEHLAIVVGDPLTREAPLVRLHSECFTGDLLGSLRCDCGMQLRGAISRMKEEGAGVVLYLAQEGRGIGLTNKLRAYALQDRGLDTLDANRALGWEPDERSFRSAAAMLLDLGLRRIRLLTNNPDKVAAMTACGLDVAAREPHAFPPNGVNDDYLRTKARRFGHLLG